VKFTMEGAFLLTPHRASVGGVVEEKVESTDGSGGVSHARLINIDGEKWRNLLIRTGPLSPVNRFSARLKGGGLRRNDVLFLNPFTPHVRFPTETGSLYVPIVKTKPATDCTREVSDPMTPAEASFAMQKVGVNRCMCRHPNLTLCRMQLTRVRVDKMRF
jgi:hypothetical protein